MNQRPRITCRSDDEGRFTGALPRAGTWPVEVLVEGNIFTAESIDVDPDNTVTEIEINLPDTTLAGAVSRQGHPVTNAVIVVRRAEDRQQIATARSDSDGRFRWHGLPEGQVAVSALVGRETSGWVFASLVDGASPPPILLEIEPSLAVRGQLLSHGTPVAGAEIDYRAGKSTFLPHTARSTTDLTGHFELTIPADEQRVDVLIKAPGAGVHITRVDLATDATQSDTVTLPTWNLPDTVSIRLPIDPANLATGDSTWLAANGTRIKTSTLIRLAIRLGTLAPTEGALWIAGLGAADYGLCDGPTGPCEAVAVIPGPPPASPLEVPTKSTD